MNKGPRKSVPLSVSWLFSKSLLGKIWFDLASYDFPVERYDQKEEILMSLSTVNLCSAASQGITAKVDEL